MTTQPYRHPVADEQTWNDALYEDLERSIVETRTSCDGQVTTFLDKDGVVLAFGCGRRREPHPVYVAQDTIETGSQVVGADDEWA
ncbi:hypothetical protein [Aeromicrobium endophyticum]|uniref:Uncharacterized protein n=1 Tax=Aeromicrobium endophyticum TaxID=2292704 RepID=A0A371PCM0_9ACTN|nr:hypothetical protein [Aeromicrobium endophyticum]REK73684.1 hypothetical protein DX116_09170 [Aeromicrobium endophyticum]